MLEASNKQRRIRNSLSREEIRDVSLLILKEEGLEGLSMRKIANRLGCSVASPYSYYESQIDLVQDLIKSGEDELLSMLKKAITEVDSNFAFEKLAAIARGYFNFASNNRELHKVMFVTDYGGVHRKAFPQLPKSYRFFLETVRFGFESGEIPYPKNEYPAIARMMWSWMYGVIVLDMTGMLRKRKGSGNPIEEGISYFQKLLSKHYPNSK
ncbi:TetR/AcrR family transcriptional regulator [Leptospira kanakyensis]|uniref:TetR/AcrR family transcriptional regulator n=1 Tax=Leptospira kanakyensis TaxID=2484968 RepID=A0A6N4QD09_9LEPT|nr:WHG domain-containing protein [Leptospira kanakyensis]MCW7468707.1 WHG domain-containing protein [Leptospira kanakyensis]MCW7479700.1 WHG domain-containing protein [Leptospira kanakyensis]TGK49939.1 TetR/AcrR family transcriptional regulator [Leptospira kanakyensis]TGK58544.1 TetR/AcrR family transcriptional regulator [Leptospira kanakyensis]TGK69077.1 TetR/AcrR family transcriptional regulator [Leptospira kanakyensis]